MVTSEIREDVKHCGELSFALATFLIGWMVFIKMLF